MLDYKRVCCSCIKQDYALHQIIDSIGDITEPCDYCGSKKTTISLGALANKTDWFIENYYRPGTYSKNKEEIEGEHLHSVLKREISSNDDVIQDLSEILTEEWSRTADYCAHGDEPHFVPAVSTTGDVSGRWREMEKNLKENNRFFNTQAFNEFEDNFGYILEHHPSAFITFKAGTSVYRGRIFQSDEALGKALANPEDELGPPPSHLAPSGRMNSKGISVFYGATSRENAISEVRPPVGSLVAVATFMLTRDIQLLDLSILKDISVHGLSRFDSRYLERYERISFIKDLSLKLTMPVVPELADTSYLLTQAIADYLSTSPKYGLNGILFDSAQVSISDDESKSRNIILFHKYSHVKDSGRRHLAAEVVMEYSDNESIVIPHIYHSPKDIWTKFGWFMDNASREDFLKLCLDCIEIHSIKGVKYETKSSNVVAELRELGSESE